MTREDIIRMAREAGFEHIAEAEHWHPYFERFHAIAVAAEREACAKVAESYEPRCEVCPSGVSNAIRARGEP